MIRFGIRKVLCGRFLQSPRYLVESSRALESTAKKLDVEPDEPTYENKAEMASEEVTKERRETVEPVYRNSINIEGYMRDKCDYVEGAFGYIEKATFTLVHKTPSGQQEKYFVIARKPLLLRHLLTKTDAGMKVLVKGGLTFRRKDTKSLAIIAHHVSSVS